jgi:two-component system OmpR family response regulator
MAAPKLRRILYVEDEPDIQAIARFSLEKVGGFEVQSCSSGEEALRAVESFLPDLILLDVMMPRMDGPTLLAELRKRPDTAAVPALFITAKVMDSEVNRYRELGAADVILKPFDPMVLPQKLLAIWERIHG